MRSLLPLTAVAAALAEQPKQTALMFDVDGTLAPIVKLPHAAAVPKPTQIALAAAAKKYALVACVSGRTALDAQRVVGLSEIYYIGSHGAETLKPGETQPAVANAVSAGKSKLAAFLAGIDNKVLGQEGIRLEDKTHMVAFHWRGAANPTTAQESIQAIAAAAKDCGLAPYWGRKVLEVRTTTQIDKGTAVEDLLRHHNLTAGMYVGDDVTDLDAFRALQKLRDSEQLQTAICVGVSSQEQPIELIEAVDATVQGPEEVLALLKLLTED